MARHEFTTEFATSCALERARVDEHNGIIYGVSVITSGVKARGHELEVDGTTLRQMKACADDMGKVPVKWNHKSGADSVAGYLKNFRIERDEDGEKLRADWHLLKSHERYAHAIELAREMPEGVGLSAAFCGDDDPKPGDPVVKLARCDELISVDLVANPAANPTGMFAAKRLSEPAFKLTRKTMLKLMDQNNQNQNGASEPSLADVLAAINHIGERLEAVEKFNAEVNDYLSHENENPEEDFSEEEFYARLLSLSEQEIAELVNSGEISPDQANEILAFQANVAAEESEQQDVGQYQDVNGVNGAYAEAGAQAGSEAGAGTALGAIHREVRSLSAKLRAKELAEEESELNGLIDHIGGNIIELAERNSELETQLEAMRYALRTSGARALKPAHGAKMFEEGVARDSKTAFEARVAEYVKNGKTRAQAVQLSAKEEPEAYAKYLAARGIIAKELAE